MSRADSIRQTASAVRRAVPASGAADAAGVKG